MRKSIANQIWTITGHIEDIVENSRVHTPSITYIGNDTVLTFKDKSTILVSQSGHLKIDGRWLL